MIISISLPVDKTDVPPAASHCSFVIFASVYWTKVHINFFVTNYYATLKLSPDSKSGSRNKGIQ
jgi:hypothetical protein